MAMTVLWRRRGIFNANFQHSCLFRGRCHVDKTVLWDNIVQMQVILPPFLSSPLSPPCLDVRLRSKTTPEYWLCIPD